MFKTDKGLLSITLCRSEKNLDLYSLIGEGIYIREYIKHLFNVHNARRLD